MQQVKCIHCQTLQYTITELVVNWRPQYTSPDQRLVVVTYSHSTTFIMQLHFSLDAFHSGIASFRYNLGHEWCSCSVIEVSCYYTCMILVWQHAPCELWICGCCQIVRYNAFEHRLLYLKANHNNMMVGRLVIFIWVPTSNLLLKLSPQVIKFQLCIHSCAWWSSFNIN